MLSLPLPPNTPELETSHDNPHLTCPICGQSYLSGALACPQCGTIFNTDSKTQQVGEVDVAVQHNRKLEIGSISTENKKVVTGHIGDQILTLNVSSSLVVGRCTGLAADPIPDIDLAPYGAREKGVSRRHVELVYKNHLLYVFDLGSSNGTWLNDRLLASHSGRPLRDGDELRLGRLTIKISFE